MLIAAGYLSSALVKAFGRTKVLQQSIFTVEQMSWSLSILLGNMVLSAWWAIAGGSWPLMAIRGPMENFVKWRCQSNTDDSSLTPETLTAVSAICSVFAVLGYDLQDIYKIFHFRASRTAAASRAVCLNKVSCTCALRGTAFGKTMIYKILSCPNRLLFRGISQATLYTFQLICFLSTCPLLLGLPVTSSTTSTQRHDPGQEGDFRHLLAKQATASSLPCPSSRGSCLNPSWNQMVVNVLLLLQPWSRGQFGGNPAAFSLSLLLGTHSPRHWDSWGYSGNKKCLRPERIHTHVLN